MEQTIQRVATQKIGNFSKAANRHRDSIYEDAFWRNLEAFCLSGKLRMCIPFGLDTMHNDVVGARWRAFCCSFWVLCDYDATKGNRWEFSAWDGVCFFSSSSQGLEIGTCTIAAGTNLMWICSNCTSAVNFRAPGHKHHVPLQQLRLCSNCTSATYFIPSSGHGNIKQAEMTILLESRH